MTHLLRQLFRFAAVGVAAMAVHFLAAVSFVHLGAIPLAANVGGFLLAVPVSYYGHRRWTFAHAGDGGFPRFAMVAATGFTANELLYALLLRYSPLRYDVALVLVLGSVAAGTYLLCRFWAFSPLRS